MRDRETTSSTQQHLATAATPDPGRRFRRSLFRGYKVHAVDDAVARHELRIVDLEVELADVRAELADARNEASELRHDLTRAKAELRYWNDRGSYIDSEVARARRHAAELEASARKRADAIEADAQERSLQLVDRVCMEANAMLQAARQEAREMFLRYEHDIDASQQRLEHLEHARTEIATAMQDALRQFESVVGEVNKAAPSKRIVKSNFEPTRRAVPTFGQRKAVDAAKRFEEQTELSVSSALSSPIPSVLGVSVSDVLDTDLDAEPVELAPLDTVSSASDVPADAPDVTHAQGPEARRSHDADAEFAELMSQP